MQWNTEEEKGQRVYLNWSEQSAFAAFGHGRQNVLAIINNAIQLLLSYLAMTSLKPISYLDNIFFLLNHSYVHTRI